jgi:hypothetical protein
MKKQVAKSEYEIQAETFLQKHGITFTAKFLFHGPHWEGEKEYRDVYELTLSKDGIAPLVTSPWGQSIVNSGEYIRQLMSNKLLPKKLMAGKSGYVASPNDPSSDETLIDRGFRYKEVKRTSPTAYDLLAGLTKYDPGTFENFCSEFGYDTDSRKAEKTYFAVIKEWSDVSRFFTKEQLEELRDIQ